MKILKTLAVATPLTISALALTSCQSNDNNKVTEEQSVSKDYSSMPIEPKYNAKSEEKIDNNKPNLPRRIDSDIIQYRNLSGKLVNVKVIGGFYADVETNISKAQKDKTDNMTAQGSISDLSGQNIIALRHLQCSNMFNKLFDIFTSPKSEGGEAITVKEYTKMMDAWSSTGVKN